MAEMLELWQDMDALRRSPDGGVESVRPADVRVGDVVWHEYRRTVSNGGRWDREIDQSGWWIVTSAPVVSDTGFATFGVNFIHDGTQDTRAVMPGERVEVRCDVTVAWPA